MKLFFHDKTMHTEDEPLDVGYSTDKCNVMTPDGKSESISGQNGLTQLIISTPFIDDALINELDTLSETLKLNALDGTHLCVVVSNDSHRIESKNHIPLYIDKEDEFADFYGVKIIDGECEGELAKALFIVAKDGTLFYDDIPSHITDGFKLENAVRKVASANECYTGKGCH